MNFIVLKYFSEVASVLSFTHAAEKLHISQQCLSQHIKRLEDYYQVELFKRKPVLKLTCAGELLLNYAKQEGLAEERLMAELSRIRKNESGKIVLGVTTPQPPMIIPPLLVKFKQRYPNIELSLKEDYTSRLEELLLNDEIDVLVGIKGSNEQYYSNLKIIELFRDKYIYLLVSDELLEQYYPDNYLNRNIYKQGINLKDFIRFPVALNSKTSRIHGEIAQYYRNHEANPSVLIESNNVLSMLPLCEQGQLAIFASQLVLRDMLYQFLNLEKRLNIFPITDCLIKSPTVLMLHKDKTISRQLSDFIEITKEAFLSYDNKLHFLDAMPSE